MELVKSPLFTKIDKSASASWRKIVISYHSNSDYYRPGGIGSKHDCEAESSCLAAEFDTLLSETKHQYKNATGHVENLEGKFYGLQQLLNHQAVVAILRTGRLIRVNQCVFIAFCNHKLNILWILFCFPVQKTKYVTVCHWSKQVWQRHWHRHQHIPSAPQPMPHETTP